MAAARFNSAISSADLISRASSMTCWPSTIFRPAFCSSNIIGGSMMSTPTGMLATPASLQQRGDFLGVALIRPKAGSTVPRRPSRPALQFSGASQGAIELVMHGGRAEVPQDRLAGARQQRPARELVALPFADLGRGDVADVVDVEDQQRAALGILQRLLDAAEPVAVHAAVVDALLEIDAHGAERRQRAAPIVARVDVLGGDLPWLARSFVHGVLLVLAIRALGTAARAFSGWLCADRHGARKGIGRTARRAGFGGATTRRQRSPKALKRYELPKYLSPLAQAPLSFTRPVRRGRFHEAS